MSLYPIFLHTHTQIFIVIIREQSCYYYYYYCINLFLSAIQY